MASLPRRGLGIRGAALLAALVALLAGWLYLSRAGSSDDAAQDGQAAVLAAIPADALFVAVVDLEALRDTSFGKQLLGKGRTIAGLGGVGEVCGRDPMEGVTQLALAMPGGTRDASFGVFAAGKVDAGLLLGCAEKIVAKRGGRPVRQTRGRFSVLRDASLELSSATLAAADGGPVVLAEPTYVDAALSLLERGGASAGNSDVHLQLRGLVEPGLLLATVVLSGEQRDALTSELRAQGMGDSPFGSLQAGALSLRMDGLLLAHAVLRCSGPPACAEVAAAIDRARAAEAGTLAARAVGLSSLLDGVSIVAEGDVVHLRVALPPDAAMTMVNRMLALRQLGRAAAPEPAGGGGGPQVPRPGPVPDDEGVRIEARPAVSASASASAPAAPPPPAGTGSAADLVLQAP